MTIYLYNRVNPGNILSQEYNQDFTLSIILVKKLWLTYLCVIKYSLINYVRRFLKNTGGWVYSVDRIDRIPLLDIPKIRTHQRYPRVRKFI